MDDRSGRRPAQPDDIAQVLTWLSIGEHRRLTGQHLVVDGGYTAGINARWIDRSTFPEEPARERRWCRRKA